MCAFWKMKISANTMAGNNKVACESGRAQRTPKDSASFNCTKLWKCAVPAKIQLKHMISTQTHILLYRHIVVLLNAWFEGKSLVLSSCLDIKAHRQSDHLWRHVFIIYLTCPLIVAGRHFSCCGSIIVVIFSNSSPFFTQAHPYI